MTENAPRPGNVSSDTTSVDSFPIKLFDPVIDGRVSKGGEKFPLGARVRV